MKKIKEDIKNSTFSKVYLLYGDEAYLRNDYKNRLFHGAAGADEMNVKAVRDESFTISELKEFTDMFPFMAERRVLLMENSGLFAKGEESEAVDWLRTLPDTAVVIFSEDKVDGRSSLFKLVQKLGYAVSFTAMDENTRKKYVLKLIQDAGLNITRDGFDALMESLPAEMADLRNEVEKLIDYALEDAVIRRESVEAVILPLLESKVFAIVDDIALKRRKEALDKYYDLLALKEPLPVVMSSLSRQFYRLLQTKECFLSSLDDADIARALSISPNIVWKYKKTAQSFTYEQLFSILQYLLRTDYQIKTGELDMQSAFELILFNLTDNKGEVA